MFILGKAYSVKADNQQEEEAMKLYISQASQHSGVARL